MENQNDVQIAKRFFDALDHLKADGCIRGLKTVTDRYGLNRWNVATLRDNLQERIGSFRSSWLQFLVRDFHVNPYWLLLGEGEFYSAGFNADLVKKLQGDCKRKSAVS